MGGACFFVSGFPFTVVFLTAEGLLLGARLIQRRCSWPSKSFSFELENSVNFCDSSASVDPSETEDPSDGEGEARRTAVSTVRVAPVGERWSGMMRSLQAVMSEMIRCRCRWTDGVGKGGG